LWDFSLVDPDNRRPVDYELRERLLHELEERAGREPLVDLARDLVGTREDGRIKLYVTWRALHCVREHPGLFTAGEYLPAEVSGPLSKHVCAFVRRTGDAWAVVAVPRLLVGLLPNTGDLPLGPAWQSSVLVLPNGAAQPLRNVFTGEVVTPTVHGGRASLPLAEVFASFPVALLVAGAPDGDEKNADVAGQTPFLR
jgi:(1->4)-alpha-D-glucan 1-alpha-D-glucosylmutase